MKKAKQSKAKACQHMLHNTRVCRSFALGESKTMMLLMSCSFVYFALWLDMKRSEQLPVSTLLASPPPPTTPLYIHSLLFLLHFDPLLYHVHALVVGCCVGFDVLGGGFFCSHTHVATSKLVLLHWACSSRNSLECLALNVKLGCQVAGVCFTPPLVL